MANQITINFEPCTPAPSGGYLVQYRPVGSSDPYIQYPTPFFGSPIVFTDEGAEPDGTEYEGFLFTDCGEGNPGTPVAWSSEDCDAVTLPEDIAFPDAIIGVPYSYSFVLGGSAPFALAPGVIKPSWMTITIVGNNVNFAGTPPDGSETEDFEIVFTITNCSGTHSAPLPEGTTINVLAVNLFIENLTTDNAQWNIQNFTGVPGWGPGTGYTIVSGAFPVGPGQTLLGVHTGYPGPLIGSLTVHLAGGTPNKKIQVRKNGIIVFTQNLAATSLVYFTGLAFTAADEIRIQIVHI